MATKQFYVDGTNGVVCIVNYANAVNARVDPLNNLPDVYFHSSLPYLTYRETIVANVSFNALARVYYSWSSKGC